MRPVPAAAGDKRDMEKGSDSGGGAHGVGGPGAAGAPGRPPGALPFAWSPAPPVPLRAPLSQGSRRARGAASGAAGTGVLGALAGWAGAAELARAPQGAGWELLPSGTPRCQGGGVPLRSASHPSPPARRGILPAGVGPVGHAAFLPARSLLARASAPVSRRESQSELSGSFPR